MASMYQWAYVIMQIPAGLLVDRYGPRKLLTIAIILVAGGTMGFATTHSVTMAFITRALVGAGSAFAFVCSLKLIAEWFSPTRFAVIAGLTQFLGYMGASLGGAPLRYAVQSIGWRHSLMDTAYFGIIMAITVWLVVRDRPKGGKTYKITHGVQIMRGLREVVFKKQMWLNGLYACCMMGPTSVFIAAWGSNYLHYVDGKTFESAAAVVSIISIGVAIGSPCFGWFSDRLQKRRTPMIYAAIGALVVTSSILYWATMPMWLLYGCCFLFGFFQSAHVLNFAVAHEINRPAANGAAIGVLNMLTVLGGAIFQPLVGIFLEHGGHTKDIHGVSLYSIHQYHWSLLLLPVVQTIAFFLAIFFIKETHCKPKQEYGSVLRGHVEV